MGEYQRDYTVRNAKQEEFEIEEGHGREGLNKLFFIAGGVGLNPLYCGHFWPIVPAPDDR
jgi:hypothetical protein